MNSLRPINPDNAWRPRITAAAGTRLAAPYSTGTVSRLAATSSLSKGVYDPKTFFLHAASLRQAFAHCEIFSTAASRRSQGRVSVPCVGERALTPPSRHRLGRPLPHQLADSPQASLKVALAHLYSDASCEGRRLSGISPAFAGLYPSLRQVPTCY